ncbi:hypothetical protein D3C84_1265650 [compost metagenome]
MLLRRNRADLPTLRTRKLINFSIHETLDLVLRLVGQLEAVAAEKLNAVIFNRIMRSRDHDTGIRPEHASQVSDSRR